MTLSQRTYLDYLKSEHWSNLREQKFRDVGHRCQFCGSSHILHCHHRIYRHPMELCTTGDLIVLCEKCHVELHLMARWKRLDLALLNETSAPPLLGEFRRSSRYLKWLEKQRNRTRLRIGRLLHKGHKKRKPRKRGKVSLRPCAAIPENGKVVRNGVLVTVSRGIIFAPVAR